MSDADNAENKLQDLGDKAKEAVDKVTGHKSTDDAGDKVKEAGEKFGEKLKDAGEKVKDAFKKE